MYLSITGTSGITELGVLGGRASGKEDGNTEKCASHVWWKNKKKSAGWDDWDVGEKGRILLR